MSTARIRILAIAVALAGSGVAISLLHAQQNGSPPWTVGDVFVAIGDGKYEIRDKANNYQVKQTIQVLASPKKDVGGCWFDSTFNVYLSDVENTKVVKYNLANSHSALPFADPTTLVGAGGSNSIVMAVNGDVYVGHKGGAPNKLVRYRSDGTLPVGYSPSAENGGVDWMDLATDQKTLFYTSRGREIRAF